MRLHNFAREYTGVNSGSLFFCLSFSFSVYRLAGCSHERGKEPRGALCKSVRGERERERNREWKNEKGKEREWEEESRDEREPKETEKGRLKQIERERETTRGWDAGPGVDAGSGIYWSLVATLPANLRRAILRVCLSSRASLVTLCFPCARVIGRETKASKLHESPRALLRGPSISLPHLVEGPIEDSIILITNRHRTDDSQQRMRERAAPVRWSSHISQISVPDRSPRARRDHVSGCRLSRGIERCATRSLKKTYRALIHGWLRSPEIWNRNFSTLPQSFSSEKGNARRFKTFKIKLNVSNISGVVFVENTVYTSR